MLVLLVHLEIYLWMLHIRRVWEWLKTPKGREPSRGKGKLTACKKTMDSPWRLKGLMCSVCLFLRRIPSRRSCGFYVVPVDYHTTSSSLKDVDEPCQNNSTVINVSQKEHHLESRNAMQNRLREIWKRITSGLWCCSYWGEHYGWCPPLLHILRFQYLCAS